MKTINPITINDAILTDSTIAEPAAGEVAWNAATNYALGDRVIRSTTHKIYENVLAGVHAGLPETTPTRWLEVGSTNRWSMFDTLRNTSSVANETLNVTLTPNQRFNSIGILSVIADSVTVTVTDGAEVVFTETRTLKTRNVLNWYEYFFKPFGRVPNVVMFNIPPFKTAVIEIIFTAVSTISVGAIVIGTEVDIGKAVYGASSEELNFSRIDREVTGEAIILRRRSVPKINMTLIADKVRTNTIREIRKVLNAVPTVWSGLDDLRDNPYFESVLLLAIYKKFVINISTPEHTTIELELEEL